MLGKIRTSFTTREIKHNLCIMCKLLPVALIAAVLILLVGSLRISADSTLDGFDYKVINENEIQIRDYTGILTEVTIPEMIDGMPVTTIYEFNSADVTKVTIPKTVKTIYGAAFRNMPNLTEVCFDDFSEGFVTVGKSAFPDSVSKISFPANMTDREIQKKMTLVVFPSEAALYSGAEPLPHDYVYTPVNGGTQHYLQCTACNHIDPDSYEDHVFEGDFFINPSFNNETHHYQYCKCGTSYGELHEWDDGVEEDDVKTYTCKDCGATKTEAVEHNYVLTPDSTGLRHCLKCTKCDKIKPDSYEDHVAEGDFITDNPNYDYEERHYQKCKCGIVMGKFHEWSSSIKTQPTCTESGVMTYQCTVCGITKTEPVNALEHSFTNYISNNDATCTEDGTETAVCGRCSETSIRTAVGSKKGHTSDNGTITKQPTETDAGVRTFKCTVCGIELRTETISPIPAEHTHNYSTAWSYDTTSHWHECSCGEKSDTAAHTSDGGTVTKQPTATETGVKTFKCTVCGYVMNMETIPATGTPTAPVTPPSVPSIPSNPTTSVTTPTSKEPFIQGDNGKIGWGAISDTISNTPDGGTVTVNMNNTTELPKNIVSDIAGRDIDLVLDMGSGFSWTINGMSVTKAKTVDMKVRKVSKIPQSVIDEYFGNLETIQIALSHNGDFGFIAVLTIDLGNKYDGMYANSYCYKSRKFEFGDSSEIVNGQAKLRFTHASSWLITIESSPVLEDVSSAAGVTADSDIIDSDKTVSHSFFSIILILGIGLVYFKKSRQK